MLNFIVLATALFVLPKSIFADKSSFCQRARSPVLVKLMASDPLHHMAFKNQGGIMNAGVCWWHSFLQRSALHLASYEVNAPKPTEHQVRKILNQLKRNSNVVIIPGYDNFYSFTKDWQPTIQKFLNEWQLEDGFIFQEWTQNVLSPPRLPDGLLRMEMERIFNEVVIEDRIAWVMLKLPGLPAHAWLVIHVDRDDQGMNLWVLDSNHPQNVRIERYDFGTTAVKTRDFGDGTPYLRHTFEQHLMDRAVANYCR